MTLEDFFTLTEMKDGLTAPARVKELIDIMQEDKQNILKNVGDVTRQWSTVAKTIVATENKDCLDLFLQLDGLVYFDSWLKDAQKFGSQTGDSFVEESITELLEAIGKLHEHSQKSVNSGILMTIKNLLGHKSSRVKDKARTLFDSWKQSNDSIVAPEDASKLEAGCEGQPNASTSPGAERDRPECSVHDTSPSRGSDNEGKNVDARDKMTESTYSESHKQKGIDDINIQTSDRTLDQESMKDGTPDSARFSDRLKPVSDNSSVQENTATYGSEATTGNGNGGSAVPEQDTLGGQPDVTNSSDHDDGKQIQQTRSRDKSDVMDTSSSADFANAAESKIEPDVDENVDFKEDNNSREISPTGNAGIDVSKGKDGMSNTESENSCRKTLESKATKQDHDSNADVLQNKVEHTLEIREVLAPNSSSMENTGVIEGSVEQDNDKAEDDLSNDLQFFRSAVETKDSDVTDKGPDIELDYGAFDPLEVARRVANEVERQVGCRDTSCSSSERTSGGGIRLSKSPDSINGNKGRVIHCPSKDVHTRPNLTVASEDETFINAEIPIAEQESHLPDVAATRGSEEALKTESDTDKRICGFDLNEEVLSDDMDHNIIPLAPPISVVSASRAAAATGLPNAPLEFEGSLGWKGSAETSAFRPAPPRQTSDREKPLFASGSHNISSQRQNYLDFDLNVAEHEHEDDKITDLMLGKEVQNSFGGPSRDSSIEVVGPKGSDRLQLDLNRVSDGDDAPPHWRTGIMLLQQRNGNRSPSPSSSSSSMQPTLRNIDLNDQPSFFNDFSDPSVFGKSQILSTAGEFKPDDSVISIMGAKVEINRKESVPHTIPLLNGRTSDHSVDSSTRIGGVYGIGSSPLYAPSPVYGYNVPPSGSAMPFSSAMYGLGGHIPYMVDSRGSPVVPQILGSASAIPAAFSQPPFITSMAGAPLWNNFDLNSGSMSESVNRDNGGLRNFFNSGQGRQVDEDFRGNPQPSSSSGVGGKRKETDGGWEPFPFNYKHHQPPWK